MAVALPCTLISPGPSFAMAQNTEYALPGKLVFVQATVALETSVDGTNWAALTGGTTGVATAAQFVRSTTGAATISVKKY